MISSEKMFESIFFRITKPMLTDLNFIKVSLPQGWIQPTFLYKHKQKDVWFACSWDWRDQYFEADLGELFLIKDVLPRAVVVGNNLDQKVSDTTVESLMVSKFNHVNQRMGRLVSNNYERYSGSIVVRNKRVAKLRHLIVKKVEKLEELPFIIYE